MVAISAINKHCSCTMQCVTQNSAAGEALILLGRKFLQEAALFSLLDISS
jgi:hypothetical protein